MFRFEPFQFVHVNVLQCVVLNWFPRLHGDGKTSLTALASLTKISGTLFKKIYNQNL